MGPGLVAHAARGDGPRLTDETFALGLPFFQRSGRPDRRAYWMVAAIDVLPWIVLTVVGYLGGELIPDPTRLGLDVVFPAATGGLALALISQRRDVVAAIAGSASRPSAAWPWSRPSASWPADPSGR